MRISLYTKGSRLEFWILRQRPRAPPHSSSGCWHVKKNITQRNYKGEKPFFKRCDAGRACRSVFKRENIPGLVRWQLALIMAQQLRQIGWRARVWGTRVILKKTWEKLAKSVNGSDWPHHKSYSTKRYSKMNATMISHRKKLWVCCYVQFDWSLLLIYKFICYWYILENYVRISLSTKIELMKNSR